MYPPDGPDVVCRRSTTQTKHDPPLLFNLNDDPGELNPLNTNEIPYKEILQTINGVSCTTSYYVGKLPERLLKSNYSVYAKTAKIFLTESKILSIIGRELTRAIWLHCKFWGKS